MIRRDGRGRWAAVATFRAILGVALFWGLLASIPIGGSLAWAGESDDETVSTAPADADQAPSAPKDAPRMIQYYNPRSKLTQEPTPAAPLPDVVKTEPAPPAAAEAPRSPVGEMLLDEPMPVCKMRCGVQCTGDRCCDPLTWRKRVPIPWEAFAQGEYVGPARTEHVPEYRLRVDDTLQVVYRLSGKVAARPYRLNVRDRVLIESLTAPQTVDRQVTIQPDGNITLRMLGQVRAAGLTLEELRDTLEQRYQEVMQKPTITVTPVELNSNLMELRNSVDSRYGVGGQTVQVRVTPEGTIALPAVGSVPTQGLTLAELEREITERYQLVVDGLEVTPILAARAPRYVYVLGEVKVPGRFVMEQPTTVMQAIAMAGGWNTGAHLHHVVVLRRDERWRLMATKLDLHAALFGKRPCPADEIWLRDSDLVLLPKSPLLATDDLIQLTFTRGLYSVIPLTAQLNFAKLSTL
jgi:polysaccharide export outer membrane protein